MLNKLVHCLQLQERINHATAMNLFGAKTLLVQQSFKLGRDNCLEAMDPRPELNPGKNSGVPMPPLPITRQKPATTMLDA